MIDKDLVKHGNVCPARIPGETISIKEARKLKAIPLPINENARPITNKMQMDELGQVIMRDPVLVDYINYLAITLHDPQDEPSIRLKKASLRRLGRLLVTAQKMDLAFTFDTLLENTQFENIVTIAKAVPVKTGTTERTRSLIGFDLKNLIKRQVEILRMKPNTAERNRRLDIFKNLNHNMGDAWAKRINSKVHHNTTEVSRNQRKDLVKIDDVKNVFAYCSQELSARYHNFKELKNEVTYRSLAEILMSWIILFNFR